jgi:ATP-dependent Lon protease
MFITTANTLNIPGPLMDRMEIIRIAGYTEDEKREIAKRHLMPKAIKKHGCSRRNSRSDDDALMAIIRRYTREAGVRNLERELMKLARKAVKELLLSRRSRSKVTEPESRRVSWCSQVSLRRDRERRSGRCRHRSGLDGSRRRAADDRRRHDARQGPHDRHRQPADVMKESISAAASYVRSRAIDFGIEPPLFDKRDIHVHVPEGATPKDGPSAGVGDGDRDRLDHDRHSRPHGCRHDRRDHAARQVLPIGGLKEKLLAAAARRHQDGADPRGQRQGSGGDSGQREEQHGDHPRASLFL